MKTYTVFSLCGLAIGLTACSTSSRAPSPLHRPVSPVSPAVMNQVAPPPDPQTGTVQFDGDIAVPGVYRGYLVNGHLRLVRETDPRKIAAAPSSMRIVLGNPESGEIAYQPLMLEQEHAIELARTRQQNAENKQMFVSMVEKTGELQRESRAMRSNTVELAKGLQTEAAYIKELEAKIARLEAEKKEQAAKATPSDGGGK